MSLPFNTLQYNSGLGFEADREGDSRTSKLKPSFPIQIARKHVSVHVVLGNLEYCYSPLPSPDGMLVHHRVTLVGVPINPAPVVQRADTSIQWTNLEDKMYSNQ